MNKEDSRHYSYFLIKPDGIKYLKEIREHINSKGFDRELYFAVNDWEKVQKDLYEEHYKKESFRDSYQAFIDAEKILYGNRAIAMIVASKGEGYQELMDKVYQTKLEIRKDLAYRVGLVTIANEFNDKKANQILIAEEQGRKIKKVKRFDGQNKRYRLGHLDVIHCPDPEKETTLRELNKLFNQGVISDENLISQKLINNIEKYKTAEFLQDQSENLLHTSNYSGHILKEIEEDFDK